MKTDAALIVGAGFLGRAIALRLAAAGRRVTVLSPRAGQMAWPDGVSAVSGRQEDSGLMADLLAGHATVIHAAWGTTPGSSAGQPALEAQLGLLPFLVFLDTLQRVPGRRLLFLSSGGTVYGDAGSAPAGEEAPLAPRSCHGAGKASAELFIKSLGLDALILRPSNIYGPGQALRPGFGVVPHLLRCALEGRPFTLWGDGGQVRDYLYIDDFVEAVVALLARPHLAGPFNVGSGRGTSLRELIGVVEAASGKRLRIESQSPRDGDVMHSVLDIGRLRHAAGWRPSTELEAGIPRTLERLLGTA